MHLKLGTAEQVQVLKTRLKDKLLRRHSSSPSTKSTKSRSSQDSGKKKRTSSSVHTRDDDRPASNATNHTTSRAPSSIEPTPASEPETLTKKPSTSSSAQPSPRAASRSWELTADDDGSATTPGTMETPQDPGGEDEDEDEDGEEEEADDDDNNASDDSDEGDGVVGGGRVPGSRSGAQSGETAPAGSSASPATPATATTALAHASPAAASNSAPGSDQHQHHPQHILPPSAPLLPLPLPTIAEPPSSSLHIAAPTTPLPSIREHSPDTQHGLSPPAAAAASTTGLAAAPFADPSVPSTPITPIHSRRGVLLHDLAEHPGGSKLSTPRSHATVLSDSPTVSPSRPSGPVRRQSLVSYRHTALINTLLNPDHAGDIGHGGPYNNGTMAVRKIWVKRPLASATLVSITQDDLVDDVRDQILRKYTNSLGRQFDAPDLVIRLCSRDPQQPSRCLQPDEPIWRLIDGAYPGGQTAEEALLIDIPSRRTPKASPNPRFFNDDRPHESGTDYFPPYPAGPTIHHSSTHLQAGPGQGANGMHFPPSMGVVNGNALPPLPSPGSVRRLAARPMMIRGHTASPAASNPANGASAHPPQSGAQPTTSQYPYATRPSRSRTHSGTSTDHPTHAAPPSTISSPPPAPEHTTTPPPRVASPRPSARAKKTKKIEKPAIQSALQSKSGLLNGSVPPINVLIVEDNIINLKLLEAFVKRLKVRWQTAMNGRDAVTKWRTGGFHLVLMDIQLPIMNGLDATREIRRLEKVNSIGVFSTSASSAPEENHVDPDESDKLSNTEMFKSPVIIVALTASSLQSDRHEALAAGCNDFLTKPVNFVWLERKVMEWGCMQALIDFDGWRKWKDFSQKAQEAEVAKKAAAAKAKARKDKGRLPTPVAT